MQEELACLHPYGADFVDFSLAELSHLFLGLVVVLDDVFNLQDLVEDLDANLVRKHLELVIRHLTSNRVPLECGVEIINHLLYSLKLLTELPIISLHSINQEPKNVASQNGMLFQRKLQIPFVHFECKHQILMRLIDLILLQVHHTEELQSEAMQLIFFYFFEGI